MNDSSHKQNIQDRHRAMFAIMRAYCDSFIAHIDSTMEIDVQIRKVMHEMNNSEVPDGIVVQQIDNAQESSDILVLETDEVDAIMDLKKDVLLQSIICKLVTLPVDRAISFTKDIFPNVAVFKNALGRVDQDQQHGLGPLASQMQTLLDPEPQHLIDSKEIVPALCQLLSWIWPADRDGSVESYVQCILKEIFGTHVIAHKDTQELANMLSKYVDAGNAEVIKPFLIALIYRGYISGLKMSELAGHACLFNDVTFLRHIGDPQEEIWLSGKNTAQLFGKSISTLRRLRENENGKSTNFFTSYCKMGKGDNAIYNVSKMEHDGYEIKDRDALSRKIVGSG